MMHGTMNIKFCEVIAMLSVKINSRISPLKFYELNNMHPCHPTILLRFHRCHGNRSDFLDIYQLQGKSLCSLMWELQNCFSPASPPPLHPPTQMYSKSNPWDTGTPVFSLLLKLRLWDTTLVLSSQTVTS